MPEEPASSPHAIVPGDADRELTLPEDLIRRGLELAVSIEQALGIEPFVESPAREVYAVRCYPAIMEWFHDDEGSYKLREADEGGSRAPVHFDLSVEKDRLLISCAPATRKLKFGGIEDNEDRYRLLNAHGNLDPFAIPFSSLGLFYKLSSPLRENLLPSSGLSRLSKEELSKFKFTLGPTGYPGYKGPVTKEANRFFNADRDSVEIVVIYISVLADPNLSQSLVAKKPPLKLTFVVVDEEGTDDPAATYQLYHAMLAAKDALSASK